MPKKKNPQHLSREAVKQSVKKAVKKEKTKEDKAKEN